MVQEKDLTLPPTAPQLGNYDAYNWTDASFALYTLLQTNDEDLQALASQLEQEWQKNQGYTGSHLVRVAPTHNFENKTLQDVNEAHVSLLEETAKHIKYTGGNSKGDLEWFPTAFIVLTAEDIEKDGLLFVYADDEVDRCPLDKSYFKKQDAYMMLSSIAFGDEYCARSKEIYGFDLTDST